MDSPRDSPSSLKRSILEKKKKLKSFSPLLGRSRNNWERHPSRKRMPLGSTRARTTVPLTDGRAFLGEQVLCSPCWWNNFRNVETLALGYPPIVYRAKWIVKTEWLGTIHSTQAASSRFFERKPWILELERAWALSRIERQRGECTSTGRQRFEFIVRLSRTRTRTRIYRSCRSLSVVQTTTTTIKHQKPRIALHKNLGCKWAWDWGP